METEQAPVPSSPASAHMPISEPVSVKLWLIGLLVAGLAFETISIGVLGFRASDLEQRVGAKDGELQAFKAESEMKLTAAKTGPAGTPRATVTLTPEEQNDRGYGLTPLNRMVNAASSADNCTSFSNLADDKDPTRLQYFTSIAEFVGTLADKDKVIGGLMQVGRDSSYSSGGRLCKDAQHLYAFLVMTDTSVQPMWWSGSGLLSYGSILKTADSYFTFTPNAIDGRPIFGNGYGDAGHWWWSYYLPTADNTDFDRIETCSANFLFDDAEGGFKENQIEYECSRAWQS